MTGLTRVRSRDQILDVVHLAREIWTDHYVPIIGQEQVDYMLGRFQSEEAVGAQLADGYEYYTVPHNGTSAGYMAIVPDADADALMISKIYVRRAARGRGFGRAMLAFAGNVCREGGISTLWLTVNKNNIRSIEWYMQTGFRKMGSTVQDIGGGFFMDDYRMEKNLNGQVDSTIADVPKTRREISTSF